ncbi:MAG TPA: hypothetical protein VGC81_18015 [Candidatus Methylomirabilis sp.]
MILARVTPYFLLPVRGKSFAVQRIESGLRVHGVTGQVFSPGKKGVPA